MKSLNSLGSLPLPPLCGRWCQKRTQHDLAKRHWQLFCQFLDRWHGVVWVYVLCGKTTSVVQNKHPGRGMGRVRALNTHLHARRVWLYDITIKTLAQLRIAREMFRKNGPPSAFPSVQP